jgi:hypothetical protein
MTQAIRDEMLLGKEESRIRIVWEEDGGGEGREERGLEE